MSLGRPKTVLSVLSGVVLAGGAALAQPTGGAAAPPAPATGSGAEGSAVAPIEDAPPSDMEGRDENPDAPRTGDEPTGPTPGPAPVIKKSGYPIELVDRPITLPQNMGEVSIGPHITVDPFTFSDALQFRFGVTRQIQIGVAYVYGGVYDADPLDAMDDTKFHAGKAGMLDVTYLLQNWIGIRVGVPVYLDPFAMSFNAGAPMRFKLHDKVQVGGLEDVVNITLYEFPPSIYNESLNGLGALNKMSGTGQSRGRLRFSGYAVYQQSMKLALIGRIGLDRDLGAGGGGAAGTSVVNETQTFLRAGLQFSPNRNLDVGGSVGFDDLATADSFGVAAFFAVRI
jgi:hypothetical protein